jgi:hypothetical protein
MGKRKDLEEAWRGPQYTFRSDESEEKEEMRKSSLEDSRVSSNEESPSNEEKSESFFEDLKTSSNEEKQVPSLEEVRVSSLEGKRISSFENSRENVDPLKKFNAMLPETLFFEWKTYCTKKRCKMQDLTAQALRQYMEENP